jgi:hypothetical protein
MLSARGFRGSFPLAAVVVVFCASAILGQEGLSTLRCTVIDKSGAVVAGANVSVREVLTNIVARTETTDAQGNYEMPGLKTGTYEVTATLAGFKKSITDGVVLQSNLVRRVDITLELGELASEVLVNASSATIQTEQACNGNLPTGQRTVNRWFNPACFVDPPAGRFGNSRINILEGPGMHVLNFTLPKRFPLTEKVHFDLMFLVGNVFNHPNFQFPASDISVPGGAGVINSVYGLYAAERAGPRMGEFVRAD